MALFEACRNYQWERASFTNPMLWTLIAETWQPRTCHESRVEKDHILFLLFLFLAAKQNARQESQLTSSIFVFLLKSRLITQVLWDLMSVELPLWNWVWSRGLAASSNAGLFSWWPTDHLHPARGHPHLPPLFWLYNFIWLDTWPQRRLQLYDYTHCACHERSDWHEKDVMRVIFLLTEPAISIN